MSAEVAPPQEVKLTTYTEYDSWVEAMTRLIGDRDQTHNLVRHALQKSLLFAPGWRKELEALDYMVEGTSALMVWRSLQIPDDPLGALAWACVLPELPGESTPLVALMVYEQLRGGREVFQDQLPIHLQLEADGRYAISKNPGVKIELEAELQRDLEINRELVNHELERLRRLDPMLLKSLLEVCQEVLECPEDTPLPADIRERLQAYLHAARTEMNEEPGN